MSIDTVVLRISGVDLHLDPPDSATNDNFPNMWHGLLLSVEPNRADDNSMLTKYDLRYKILLYKPSDIKGSCIDGTSYKLIISENDFTLEEYQGDEPGYDMVCGAVFIGEDQLLYHLPDLFGTDELTKIQVQLANSRMSQSENRMYIERIADPISYNTIRSFDCRVCPDIGSKLLETGLFLSNNVPTKALAAVGFAATTALLVYQYYN